MLSVVCGPLFLYLNVVAQKTTDNSDRRERTTDYRPTYQSNHSTSTGAPTGGSTMSSGMWKRQLALTIDE